MNARDPVLLKLYEAEGGRLRSFVRRIVGNPATAEDLVQQAFTNILGRFDEKAPSSAYLVQAVRNLALNHLRDARRRAELEISGLDVGDIADGRPTPETVALYRSELRHLLESVAALSPRRKEAFVFNRIEGLSYDEVAERMGISRNTVISLVVAAMAELDRRI